jgi:hypothetical protein
MKLRHINHIYTKITSKQIIEMYTKCKTINNIRKNIRENLCDVGFDDARFGCDRESMTIQEKLDNSDLSKLTTFSLQNITLRE